VSGAARTELSAELDERGHFETPTKLADVLSAPTIERLEAYLEQRGLPFSFVEGMKPWYITNVLVAMELREGGYEAEHGVDLQFIRRSDRKPLVEIETASGQLELLDRLPMRIQEAMLWDALDPSREFDRATDQLIEAWRRGDERAVAPVPAAGDGVPQSVQQRLRVRGIGPSALNDCGERKRDDAEFVFGGIKRQAAVRIDFGDRDFQADACRARAQQRRIGNHNETGKVVTRRKRETQVRPDPGRLAGRYYERRRCRQGAGGYIRLTTKASSRSRRIQSWLSSSILLLRMRASQLRRLRSSVLS